MQAEDVNHVIHNAEENETHLEDCQGKPALSYQDRFAPPRRIARVHWSSAVIISAGRCAAVEEIFKISRAPRQKQDRHPVVCVYRLLRSVMYGR